MISYPPGIHAVPDFNFPPKIVRCVCDFESCPASDSARLLPAGSTSVAVSRLADVPRRSAGKTPAVAFQAPIMCWASRPCIRGLCGVPRGFRGGTVGFPGISVGVPREFLWGSVGFRRVPRESASEMIPNTLHRSFESHNLEVSNIVVFHNPNENC